MIEKKLPEPDVKECATCYRKGTKMKGELLHWPSENATAPVTIPSGMKIEPFSIWLYECQWCRGVETKRRMRNDQAKGPPVGGPA